MSILLDLLSDLRHNLHRRLQAFEDACEREDGIRIAISSMDILAPFACVAFLFVFAWLFINALFLVL